jgi:hypothetical protein
MNEIQQSRLTAGRVLRWAVLPLVLLLAAGTVADSPVRAEPGSLCIPIRAKIASSFVDLSACDPGALLCTTGEISGGGLLNGTTRFAALGLGPGAGLEPAVEPDLTLAYSGELEVTTESGIIVFRDVGIFDTDPAVAGFSELDRVVPELSNGRFTDASGLLFISGNATPDGLGFEGDISGEICILP